MGEFNMSGLRQTILEALAKKLPESNNSTAVAMEFLHRRTVKEASLWITFLILASSSLASFKKIPWDQRSKRRFHVTPFAATVATTLAYFFMAWFFLDRTSCTKYHLEDPTASSWEWDNWKPGAIEGEGHSQLEICRDAPAAGIDGFQWRFILILWISQLATCAGNSLMTGFTVHGLITVFDNHGNSDSDRWQMVLRIWPWSVAAISLVWSFYRTATRNDAQYRKFVFSLAGYVSVLYGLQGLVLYWGMRRNSPPSDFEYVVFAILDVLLNAGLSMWLFKTDIPDVGDEDDPVAVVGQPRPFQLSNITIALLLVQVAIWYQAKIES